MQEILELGKELEIGKQYRLICPGCGRRILSITNTGTCIKALCHSTKCVHNKGYNIPLKLGSLSTKQLQKISKSRATKYNNNWKLPIDTTSILPTKFIKYLKTYSVDNLYNYYNYCYSPSLDRLIIPYKEGYLSRSLTELPKWKNYLQSDFISRYNPTIPKDVICIVEDPISCIKLGEVVRSIALLKTSLTDKLFYKLAKLPNPTTVYIWLDGDIAGYLGTSKLVSRLSQLGNIKCKIISIQNKDPKDISYYQIKKELNIC